MQALAYRKKKSTKSTMFFPLEWLHCSTTHITKRNNSTFNFTVAQGAKKDRQIDEEKLKNPNKSLECQCQSVQ